MPTLTALLEAIPPEAALLATIVLAAVAAYLGGRNAVARRKVIRFETMLRRFLRTEFDLPSPAVETIKRKQIDVALADAIPAYDRTNNPIRTVYSDGTYLAPVPADLDMVLALSSGTQWLPYRPERFDCENFAGAFRTLAAFVAGVNTVGIVYDWSGGHAYNVVVDAAGEVTFYEPQDDEIVELGASELYTLENALIVF